jgi:hypothetical protein
MARKRITTLLLLILLIICLGSIGCSPDEITIYTSTPQANTLDSDMESIQIKEPELTLSNIKPIEPEIVHIKTYRGVKKRVNLQLIRRLQKQCYPACTGNTYCKDGECEALAKSYRWTAEDEHSMMLFADTVQRGTFSPGDETLPWNR